MRRLLPALLLLLLALPAAASELVVEFLDVGQGDAVLVTSPTGKRMLVDGGPPSSASKLIAMLRERGVEGLDLLVMTHPHLDHLGGLRAVVERATPKLFLEPGVTHTIPQYGQLLEALEKKGVPLKIARGGRSIDLGGGARADVLGPTEPLLDGTRSDPNANSVVLRVVFGTTSILLTGDSEADTEQRLLGAGVELGSTVLKVAHHGSKYSTTDAFLREVRPKIAVIPCGAGNDYGHPHKPLLDRLSRAGVDVLRTDLDGTVKVVSDGKKLQLFTEHEAPAASEGPVAVAPVDAGGKPGRIDPAKAVFWGSSRGKAYHLRSCPGAGKIKEKNRVGWATAKDAEGEGRKPAGDCLAGDAEGM